MSKTKKNNKIVFTIAFIIAGLIGGIYGSSIIQEYKEYKKFKEKKEAQELHDTIFRNLENFFN